MSTVAIMSSPPRTYKTPAVGQAPTVAVCRVNWSYYLDMHRCKFCKQINHRYERCGEQLAECRRGVVRIVWDN